MESTKNMSLIYAHDPMCSWCWGFVSAWEALRERLTKEYPDLKVQKLLGGLAPDSDEPMAEDMRQYLQQAWASIQQRIPGTEFNFDFWQQCEPKRSTWPSCRAVIAARQQGEQFEDTMHRAIQIGYYLNARNPSEREVLVEIAGEIGLDDVLFSESLGSDETRQAHQQEMAQVAQYGVQGFPSLVLIGEQQGYRVAIDYTDSAVMFDQIMQVVDSS